MWRVLDDEDDGKRFIVTGHDAITANIQRVALCISASYDVRDADVHIIEPNIPIVRIDLKDRSTNSHWSEDKQLALSQQFLDIVMLLAGKGVSEISLFLAAPASIALRFGTLYDKRNLPSLEVNQYEQNDPKKFPWSVLMPVAGIHQAELKER
jgi:hypothetical protein